MRLETPRLPILETERLRLEPLALTDAPDIIPMMDDPDVMAFRDSPEIEDPNLVVEVIRRQVDGMAAGATICWSIRTLAGRRFIGTCDLAEIDRSHKRAEIGFMLGRDAWTQGYAHEALRALISYAGTSGVRKLSARTHLGNRQSESLLEKLGFKMEGLLRGHILRDGERRDCHIYGLLL